MASDIVGLIIEQLDNDFEGICSAVDAFKKTEYNIKRNVTKVISDSIKNAISSGKFQVEVPLTSVYERRVGRDIVKKFGYYSYESGKYIYISWCENSLAKVKKEITKE